MNNPESKNKYHFNQNSDTENRGKNKGKTATGRNSEKQTNGAARPANENKKNTRKAKKKSPGARKQHSYAKKKISVVIPLLNEEESLPELGLQLETELNKLKQYKWEVLFIDDGSTDSSFSMIKRLNNRNNRFKAIRFRRNYGKSAALSVGFQEVNGDIVITMDADLQDDPAEIAKLINKLNEGYDLVSGWKKKRKDPITKTIPSKFYNFVTSVTSGVRLHDHNCGLKAYRKEVVKTLNVYGDMHRYLPALANWEGFRVGEIPVLHHARRYGKSKYGITRFIKGYLDLLTVLFTTRYFKRPSHFFGTFGSLFAITGLAIDIYLSIEWFLGKTALSNRPLVFLGIALIIVGVQFISMGLIGELITKGNIKNTNYSIREKI